MKRNGGQPTDRRASKRTEVQVPMNMNLNASSVVSGKTQNISPGGMKVRTGVTPPFQIRDEVMFLASEPYFNFYGQGEIVWTSPKDSTVGIKFTRLNEEARGSLDKFLSFFVNVPTNNR